MSAGVPVTREDLTAPATKADLLVVKGDLKSMKVDLEGHIKLLKSDLEGQIKDVAIDLRGEMADLRVEMANLQVSLGRTIWIAIATLGAVGIILQFFP